MDKTDLHIHTTASDGSLSPAAVVAEAKRQGLVAIALTDHDTMDGLPEAGAAGETLGVTIIPGIELSTDYCGTEVHVLGYFLDPEAQALRDYQSWASAGRERRNKRMVERLQRKGFDVSLEALQAANPGALLGRPHMARRLMELGVVDSVSEAFRRYLGEGRSCFVRREYLSMEDGARMIQMSGGAAVLAHPLQYQLGKRDLDALVQAAAQARFLGMEIYYSGYSEADRHSLFDLAEKYLLLPTGGSDFHGKSKPDISIGTGTGTLAVPAYFIAMLHAALQKQLQGET